MQIVENKVVSGETIIVDDKVIVNCRYKNCRVMYSGEDFALTGTTFENCQLMLSGAAQKTATLLGSFGMLKQPMGAPPVGGPPQTTTVQ
jgi:hypothetical protein